LDGLTDEIGTNISSFSVDTSTDSTEESDGRSTKSISSNAFEKSSGKNADSLFEFVEFGIVGICAVKLIKISPDPSRSIESGSSTNEWWNTWEVVSECISSIERILVLKEIVDVASLRPFVFFGSSTHGLISSHHFSESSVSSMELPMT
jgi:hypothetical protein